MASGKLILYSDKNKEGQQALYIKFSHKGVPALVQTPERINPDHVIKNGKNLAVVPSIPDYRKLTERLNKLSFLCASVVEQFRYRNPNTFTVGDMKTACYKAAEWKPDPIELSMDWGNAFRRWAEYRAKEEDASWNTVRHYHSSKAMVDEFFDARGIKRNIELTHVTGDMINDFVTYCLAQGKDNATVRKYISNIRACCVFHKHPEITRDWKQKRKLRVIKKQGVSFSVEEIKMMYDYQADEFFQPIKDMLFRFIASGVRWSDQDINPQHEQNGFIIKRNKKNSNLSTIPISDYLVEVLSKPKPEMTNAYFNKYAKKFCEKVGINEPVVKESAPGGVIKTITVPKWQRVSSKIGRKSLVSLLTAAGFTRAQIRKIIGNETEIEAYEVVDLKDLSVKVKESFSSAIGLN